MNVTFLSGEYPPMQGGIADYTANLAACLSGHGVASSVLTSRKWQRFAAGQPPPAGAVYPTLAGWGFRCWGQIQGHCRAYAVDVLHIQYQAAAFDLKGWVNWLPWRMRRGPNRPRLVVTFHDLRIPYIFPKAGPFRWRSILALARYSDAVVCTNLEDLETLRRELGAGEVAPRLYHIPLGSNVPVDPPPGYDRAAWRAQLGLPPDAFVLAYFGFLNESKGGEELIAVLDTLVERGYNARLLMIGGDIGASDPTNIDYARRVRTLLNERKLAERVIFTGFVDLSGVSAHLLAADVAVMPYRDGVSWRRTTLLAMLAHGLPLVTTRPAVPLPELVDGENVLLAPPRDVPALAGAVERLAGEPDLRRRLAAGAVELGRRFAWPEIARKMVGVYRDLGCA
ncbi:MAG: glycosyltransferase family 4 protein [Anaerolineae bacterium]